VTKNEVLLQTLDMATAMKWDCFIMGLLGVSIDNAALSERQNNLKEVCRRCPYPECVMGNKKEVRKMLGG